MKSTMEERFNSILAKNGIWYITHRRNKPEPGENRIGIFKFLYFIYNFEVSLGRVLYCSKMLLTC